MSRSRPAGPTLDPVIRVSRRNGRKGDSFLSPDQQRDAIAAYAEANDIRLGSEHDETDSVSGGKVIDRPGLGEALRRALEGETDGIIVAKLDRYARNLTEGLAVIEQLEAAGKQVHSAAEGKAAGTGMTPQARFIRNIMLSVAEMERDRLGAGLDHARQDSIARGIYGHAPYGYVKGPDRRLVPDEHEAPHVRAIFEQRAEGRSWSAIADDLNDAGAKPRRADGFTHRRIAGIIANRAYLGEARSGDYVNPEAHPPLVSVTLWEAANSRWETAPRRDRESFLLAGLIRCASCGVRMSGMTRVLTMADGSRQPYRYYRCRRTHSFGRCPAPASLRADEIEALVERKFRDLYFSDRPYVGNQVDDAGEELAAAKAEMAEAKADYGFFVQAKITDPDAFQAGVDVREERLRDAQDRLLAAERAMRGFALPQNLAEQWDDLSVTDRRGFLSDGLALVAVAPRRGTVAERCAVWDSKNAAAPKLTDLPGLGGGVAAITPIEVPPGTWATDE